MLKSFLAYKLWLIAPLFVASCCYARPLAAQSWKQKLIQIGKLQVYMTRLEKGYTIVREGLTWIGDLKKGDLALHADHFASFWHVNPALRNAASTISMKTMQQIILDGIPVCYEQFKTSGHLAGDQLKYIQAVYNDLTMYVNRGKEELDLLLSDNTLQMSDDQRTAALLQLSGRIAAQYHFFCSFTAGAARLGEQRAMESHDNMTLRKTFLP